jgi:hypothetical protein
MAMSQIRRGHWFAADHESTLVEPINQFSTKQMVPATHAKPTCHVHASQQTLHLRFHESRIHRNIFSTVVTKNPKFA